MSREVVDLSLTPIDVGFDLRHDRIVVALPSAARSVAYLDRDDNERTARGTTDEIAAELTAAGYDTRRVP